MFTAFFFPFLITLGMWQLEREQQKVNAESLYEARNTSEPIDLSAIDWASEDLNWTPFQASGVFDGERHLLLDNRIVNSVVGYEVITPFYTQYGTLLVNRGWVAQGPSRLQLPEVKTTAEQVTITGHIYVPDGELMILGDEEAATGIWPKVIQSVNITELSESMDETFKSQLVRLNQSSAEVYQTNWAAINMRPEVHRAYAVQWFLMAFVLLCLHLFFSIRKLEK